MQTTSAEYIHPVMAKRGQETSYFVNKLKRAVQDGDVSTAKRLIKGGVDINTTVWYDVTLLQEAVSHSNAAMVKMLLAANADVNATNKDSRTALHIVCRYGNREIFEMLVAAKADINMKTQDDRTCLHVALWRRHTELIQRLVELGCDVNAEDSDGWTPLHWAVNANLPEIVEFLIKNGAVMQAFNKRGSTPFHNSLSKDLLPIIKIMLRHGVNPNAEVQPNGNPLLLCENINTRQLLINTGFTNCNKLSSWTERLKTMERQPVAFLKTKWGNVLTLRELCRNHIRHCLLLHTGHRTILNITSQLGLPRMLQDYLELSSELQLSDS